MKLLRLNHIQNLLHFIQKHGLFAAVDLWPVPQETQQHFLRQRRILFQKLHDTVRELGVVQRERLGLVQRYQHTREERLVLFLERQGKAVDDTA